MEVAKVKLKVRDNVAGNFIYYSAFSLSLSLFLSLYFSSLSWSISSMPVFFSLYSPHFPYTLIVRRQAMERGWEQAFPSGTGQGGSVQVIIIIREAVSRFNASSLTLQHYRHIFSSSITTSTIIIISSYYWSPSYSSLPGSTRLWQQPLRNRGKEGTWVSHLQIGLLLFSNWDSQNSVSKM